MVVGADENEDANNAVVDDANDNDDNDDDEYDDDDVDDGDVAPVGGDKVKSNMRGTRGDVVTPLLNEAALSNEATLVSDAEIYSVLSLPSMRSEGRIACARSTTGECQCLRARGVTNVQIIVHTEGRSAKRARTDDSSSMYRPRRHTWKWGDAKHRRSNERTVSAQCCKSVDGAESNTSDNSAANNAHFDPALIGQYFNSPLTTSQTNEGCNCTNPTTQRVSAE